jgi:pullulanase
MSAKTTNMTAGRSPGREHVPAPARASFGLPYGVKYHAAGSVFSVLAEADAMRVRLMNPLTRRVITAPMRRSDDEDLLWTADVEGDLRGWTYEYELDRQGATLGGVIDPWATLIRRERAFIEAEDTPVADRPDLLPEEAIIYELHVRDFTIDPTSGIHSDERGTYLGLTRRGSRIPFSEVATGLDHILDLGVTVVQLMPVHSFSLPYNPTYEWGYMPNDFNAPHPGYAASVELEAPIRELKQLVSTLHNAGLRVTLDVVYNHTAESWPNKLRNMMALAPSLYYRFRKDGTPWNGSGCGNEFASETPAGRRFIRESITYWIRRFGVDGFRFDLMGLIDAETMELATRDAHAIDPTILMYGEPWPGGDTPITVNTKGFQRSKGWGVFNDEMRDGLRGEVFELADLGFLNGGTDTHAVKRGVQAGLASFADQPTETINYIECHDNHTLIDRLQVTAERAKLNELTAGDRDRMSRLGALILMTSQGIPFVHAAQEFGRSKRGYDNTYNLGDDVNNIRWHDKQTNHRLFRHYREAIDLRRRHPMFRLPTADLVRAAVAFLDDDLGLAVPGGVIGFRVTDPTGRDAWSQAICLFNGTGQHKACPLPQAGEHGPWLCDMHDGVLERGAGVAPRAIKQASCDIPRYAGLILYTPRPRG